MLIQTMIGVGLVTVTALALSSVITSAVREQKAVVQRLEISELKHILMMQVSNAATCGCQFGATNTFDSTAPVASRFIGLNQLTSACGGAAPVLAQAGELLPGTQTGLRVSSISFTQLEDLGGGAYQGYFEVRFDPNSTIRSVHPMRLKHVILSDPAAPANAKTVASCGSAGNTPICRTVMNEGVAPNYDSEALCAADEYLLSGGGDCAIDSPTYPFKAPAGSGWKGTSHASQPNGAGTGWRYDCSNWDHTVDVPSRAYAICCKK